MARVSLIAQAAHEEQDIKCVRAPDEDTEHAYIAERIAEDIAEGTPGHEIAVLVRRNADVPVLGSALARHGIAHVAHGDDPVLAHHAVAGFMTLLRAVAHLGDDSLLYPALALPYTGISNLDIYRLSTASLRKPGALYALLSDETALSALGVRDRAACMAVFALLDESARAVREQVLAASIEALLSRSGCLAHVLGQLDAFATLEILRAFFRYVRALARAHPAYTLAQLLSALDEAREYHLSLGGAALHREHAVQVMTVHRAKGMEFDRVFIPHLHDRRWGAHRSNERIKLPLFQEVSSGGSDTSEDDERRLLYVAMTRARKTLTLSYAETADDGTVQVRSRFLEELKDVHLKEEPVPPADASLFMQTMQPHGILPQNALSDEEKAFVQKRLLEQGLSATGLNNYLESPWKYFFLNLLHIPKARVPHLLYGSAIDETLKWYTDGRKAGEEPDTDAVVRLFATALSRQPLAKKDFDMYRERGTAALAGYRARYAAGWHVDAESAVRLAVPFETDLPEVPVIMMRGELDKVEHLGDDAVRIVDYKTGKPKTRGEIEGTTKTSHGNLKRQLAFYRLMVERDTTREWKTHEAVLDFVEPDTKGKYHREQFVITDDDVAMLARTIRETVKAIYECAFWDAPCEAAAWDEAGCALMRAFKNRR